MCLALYALALPASAPAHAERPTFFPDWTKGEVPQYRKTGRQLVVCAADSRSRILKMTKTRRTDRSRAARKLRRLRKRNLALRRKCGFRSIQAAVNAAQSGYRIAILPGVYTEPESQPVKRDDACGPMEENGAPSYEYQFRCPNADNLIAIMGDDPNDPDRECDQKCRLQIEGTGASPRDVQIIGRGYGEAPGAKLNLIRADRADGFLLTNVHLELSDFNNVYVLETNGFTITNVVSGYSREYSLLSFTSDNGLYDRVEAFGGGDSGIYPGSGPEGHCERYGIEVRNSDVHDTPVGISGTAGNGWYVHDNKIHHNETGVGLDSFTPNHPGMPQDCSKFVDNQIYSNNNIFHDEERTEYCRQTPPEERDPAKVCPTYFAFPGTGIIIGGGNGNIIERNHFWDNWRFAVMQIYTPAAMRDDNDPAHQMDTSHENKYRNNFMSMRPDGTRDPNGRDFWWDEQGSGNCWENNTTKGAARPDDLGFNVSCPGSPIPAPPNPLKYGFIAACLTFHPTDQPDPPGCQADGLPLFETPPEPR